MSQVNYTGVESMDDKCKNCDNKEACIPFFLHENAMMHKDRDNKRMLAVILSLCVTLVIVVVTLVSYYTSRTQMWNDTISTLTVALTEVTNAKENTPP